MYAYQRKSMITKKAEFESFFFQATKFAKGLDQQAQDKFNSKIRRTYENYSKLKIPYKNQNVIDNLLSC